MAGPFKKGNPSKKNAILAAALASALIPAPAARAPAVSDRDFVAKASIGHTFEMEEAKLALHMATGDRLKAFAQRTIADHGDARMTLEAASGKVEVTCEMSGLQMMAVSKLVISERTEPNGPAGHRRRLGGRISRPSFWTQ